MQRLKYTGKKGHLYIDYPRLSEPYLFKASGGYECLVHDVDARWLLVSHKDIFELVPIKEEPTHAEETSRKEEEVAKQTVEPAPAAGPQAEEKEIGAVIPLKRPPLDFSDIIVRVGEKKKTAIGA